MEDFTTVIEMRNISMKFAGNYALKDVSVNMNKGEIIGLVGENGAGKSTLMKILCGVYSQTEGEIYVNGIKKEFKNTRMAHKAGINMIYQELSVFPELNAVENIFISNEIAGHKNGIIQKLNKRKMQSIAEELFREQLDVRIDLRTPVRNLSLAERQMIEIGRCLYSNAAVIIMDEPTEPLEIAEQEQLFRIIKKLKDDNHTVIYISHQLGQLKEISDRIYVLRDGELVEEMNASQITVDYMIEKMIGGKVGEQYPEKHKDFGEALLEVRGLTKKSYYSDVSFKVKRGEILGIAGLSGAGKGEVLRTIYGALQADQGEIIIDGHKKELSNPGVAMKSRIGFLGAERKIESLFLDQSVEWNITISNLTKLKPWKLDKKQATEIANKYIEDLNIKTPSSDWLIGQLSGGNQQKALIARWLLFEPDIILVEEPTRGIDVRAKAEIYKMLMAYCKMGKAVVVVSSESPELMGICNNILVMYEGRVVASLDGDSTSEAEIAYYTVQETGGQKYVKKDKPV
ncbi:MAG: sugar ABC transporter ATP-binding protein [Suipraeoptans sp.]